MLYFAREVFVPLALAMLLAFLLEPVARVLERWHLGRAAAALLSILAVVIAVGAVGLIVTKQLSLLSNNLPQYETNIHKRVQHIRDGGMGSLGRAIKSLENFRNQLSSTNSPGEGMSSTNNPDDGREKAIPVEIRNQDQTLLKLMQRLVSPSVSFLLEAVLVVVFSIFILNARDDLRTRLIHIAGPHNARLTRHFMVETNGRLSRYLGMQAMVNVSYGTVIGLALWWIGLPNPLLWGISAGLFRYIPYIGPWIGASMPFAIALGLDVGWAKPLMVLGVFAVLEILTANLIEPWLYGRSAGITSFAVLLAAVFWTWLWGPVGLVLSLPLTVTLASIAKYFPELEIIDDLFGEHGETTD